MSPKAIHASVSCLVKETGTNKIVKPPDNSCRFSLLAPASHNGTGRKEKRMVFTEPQVDLAEFGLEGLGLPLAHLKRHSWIAHLEMGA